MNIDVLAALEAGYLMADTPPQSWMNLLHERKLPMVWIRPAENGSCVVLVSIEHLMLHSPALAHQARKRLERLTEKTLKAVPQFGFSDAQNVRAAGPLSIRQAQDFSRALLHPDGNPGRVVA